MEDFLPMKISGSLPNDNSKLERVKKELFQMSIIAMVLLTISCFLLYAVLELLALIKELSL